MSPHDRKAKAVFLGSNLEDVHLLWGVNANLERVYFLNFFCTLPSMHRSKIGLFPNFEP